MMVLQKYIYMKRSSRWYFDIEERNNLLYQSYYSLCIMSGVRDDDIQIQSIFNLDQLYYGIVSTNSVCRSRAKKENMLIGRQQSYYSIYILGDHTIYRRGENMYFITIILWWYSAYALLEEQRYNIYIVLYQSYILQISIKSTHIY